MEVNETLLHAAGQRGSSPLSRDVERARPGIIAANAAPVAAGKDRQAVAGEIGTERRGGTAAGYDRQRCGSTSVSVRDRQPCAIDVSRLLNCLETTDGRHAQ